MKSAIIPTAQLKDLVTVRNMLEKKLSLQYKRKGKNGIIAVEQSLPENCS